MPNWLSTAHRTLVALLALGVLSTSASLGQGEPPTIRVGAGLDVESTPVLYAQKAGLFERAGLKVEVVKLTGGGTAIAAAVAGGGLDIGKASTFALIAAHVRGVPFVLIAPAAYYTSDEPDIPLVVGTNSPLHGPKDLAGKTIAVVSLSTTMRLATEVWLDQNGVDTKTIKFVELSPPAMPAAIDQGRIDGAPLSEPMYSDAVASGKVRPIGFPYNAIGKKFELADWFTTTDWVAKHRDLAVKFAGVMQRANAYVGTHESEMAPLVASYVGVDPGVLAKMKNPERHQYFDPALVQTLIDVAAKYKAIAHGFPAAELISEAALKPPR